MLQTACVTLLCKVVLELLPLHENLSNSSTEQPEHKYDSFIMRNKRPEEKGRKAAESLTLTKHVQGMREKGRKSWFI